MPDSLTRKSYVLGLLTVIHTLNFLDRSIVNILLDSIKADLLLSDTQLGLIAGFGFAILYTLLGLPFARLADLTNRRNVVAIGVFVWSFMTALGGLAQTGLQMVLARTGVGIGEAAGAAPSQAILADLYPSAERPRILAIMNIGAPIGIFLGIFIGGWASQMFGWRAALFIAGAPGLLVAALLRFTTKEPARGLADGEGIDISVSPIGETLRFLYSQKSYVFTLLGSFFAGFGLNAIFVWSPALFGRVFLMSRSEIGTYVGLIMGIGGVIGVLGGGWIVTRFSAGDERWKTIVPALACLIAAPLLLWMLLTHSSTVALLCLAVGATLAQSIYGPVFSVYQGVAKVSMRSFATSIHHLFGTLGGLGLGALLVGMASDMLQPTLGAAGIRYALIAPIACFFPAGLFYWLGSRTIRADTHRLIVGA